VILVDTSVWIDFFRGVDRAADLAEHLESNLVLLHPWILGELVLGGLGPRRKSIIADLKRLPATPLVPDEEVLELILTRGLSREARDHIPALIEIDSDGHRAGLRPGDPRLLEIARILHEGGHEGRAELRGVMTHAGGSYDHPGAEALTAAAEQERAAVVQSAEALRDAGLPCPVVSVGSTPTAHFARDLTGVTEVRAGVYVFHDLVMAGLGVCALDDIAIGVLATVIGHQPEKGWTASASPPSGPTSAAGNVEAEPTPVTLSPYTGGHLT
jgi:D-serine deaminase-like pyridoxal phosphate-dependent protein